MPQKRMTETEITSIDVCQFEYELTNQPASVVGAVFLKYEG